MCGHRFVGTINNMPVRLINHHHQSTQRSSVINPLALQTRGFIQHTHLVENGCKYLSIFMVTEVSSQLPRQIDHFNAYSHK